MGRKHVRVRLKLALSLLWIFSLTIPASAQYEKADDNSTVTILVTLIVVLIGVILFLYADRASLKDEREKTRDERDQAKETVSHLTQRLQRITWTDDIETPKRCPILEERYQRCRITGIPISNHRLQQLNTMDYQEYLRTDEWKVRRDEMLERAGESCQVCNRSNRLEVHHRTYERRGNEAPEDLTVLCQECHGLFHRHRGMPVSGR